jgi:hypothetical protein
MIVRTREVVATSAHAEPGRSRGKAGPLTEAEDDLSAMAGVFNGLVISLTIYSAIFAVLWVWWA